MKFCAINNTHLQVAALLMPDIINQNFLTNQNQEFESKYILVCWETTWKKYVAFIKSKRTIFDSLHVNTIYRGFGFGDLSKSWTVFLCVCVCQCGFLLSSIGALRSLVTVFLSRAPLLMSDSSAFLLCFSDLFSAGFSVLAWSETQTHDYTLLQRFLCSNINHRGARQLSRLLDAYSTDDLTWEPFIISVLFQTTNLYNFWFNSNIKYM